MTQPEPPMLPAMLAALDQMRAEVREVATERTESLEDFKGWQGNEQAVFNVGVRAGFYATIHALLERGLIKPRDDNG